MRQRGFATIEAVLVAVVVLIAAGTGYYVYHANQKANQTLNTAAKAAKSSPPKTTKKNSSSKSGNKSSSQRTAEAKAPADSQSPAAGSCFTSSSSVVTIKINPDVPSPRCSKVTASQTLVLDNATGKTITATLGSKSLTIAPGQSGRITDQFGNYLQAGVHIIRTSVYGGGSGPEVWLQ